MTQPLPTTEPTPEIREVIEKAAEIIGRGRGIHWASLELNIPKKTLLGYSRDYPAVWKEYIDRTEQADRERREADLTDALRERIRHATKLIAAGAKIGKAAQQLQISLACLVQYRKEYEHFWHECLTEAKQARRAKRKQPGPHPGNAGENGDIGQNGNDGPSENVVQNITEATRHVAAGKTLREAARAMGGITSGTLSYYKNTYPGLWKAGLEAAGGILVTVPVRVGITRRTLDRIGVATRMISQGHTMQEVAENLGVTAQAIGTYARTYPALWQTALDEAGRHFAELVKRVCGTAAVMEDPTGFWKAACAAEKWAGRHGVDLFPANGKTTLCTFFRDYYQPCVMQRDASLGYKQLFEVALKRWRLITGDPPLEQIDNQLLAQFRDFLFACRSMGRDEHLAPATVANYLRHVQDLLAKAGPPGPRNRDAAGILDRVPWTRLPRINREIPKIVNDHTLGLMYDAAELTVVPRIPGIKAVDWWRALMVTAWITAARRRTLFEMEWTDYEPDHKRLKIPGRRFKNGRPQIFPLTDWAIEHLERIRTDRRLIFEWPLDIRAFHSHWCRLQWEAGIPKAEAFGLHGLRRTAITRLAHVSLSAAQLLAGHHSVDVTVQHYVNPVPIVDQAIRSMPQPPAFGGPLEDGQAARPEDDQAKDSQAA